jgi:hypothetical protein
MPNIFFACESYEADLSALIDGELAPPRAAEVGEHLSACAGCSRYFAALSGVDRVLAATAMPEVPAGLRSRLQEQIESIPEREEAARERHAAPRARRRLIRPAIGAAFALAASAVVYLAVVSEPTVDTGSEAPVAAVVEEAQVALVREPSGEEAVSDEAVELAEPVAVVVEEAQVALVREPSGEEAASDEAVELAEPVAAVVEKAQVALVREPSGEEAASDEAVELAEPVAAVVEKAQVALVREPSGEEAVSDEAVELAEPVAVVDGASELEAASDEELGVLLELEVIQDLDVIANLEMLEQLMLVGEGAS